MDYAAGLVAMQVHESDLRGAEQRIRQAREAAEREAAGGASQRTAAPARRRRFHRPAPRLA